MKSLHPFQIRRGDDPRDVEILIYMRAAARLEAEKAEKQRQVDHYTGMLAELENLLALEEVDRVYPALMARLRGRQP